MFPVWSFESTQNLSKSDVLLGIKEFRADNQIFSDIVNINIRFNYSSNTFQSQISLKFLHWLKYFDWIFFNFQLDMLPLRRGATVVEEQNINAAPGPQLSTALPQYLTLNSHRTSVNLSEPQRASYGTSSCYCHSQWRVNSGASGDVSNCGKYSSHSTALTLPLWHKLILSFVEIISNSSLPSLLLLINISISLETF